MTTDAETLQIDRSLDAAFVYLPAGFRGLLDALAGTLDQLRTDRPDLLNRGPALPVVVLLPGSMDRGIERLVAEDICRDLQVALVSLNTHAVAGRPSYRSPADRATYRRVHAFRLAEVDHFLSASRDLGFIDRSRMILMGVSEGAVAAACHPDPIFGLRLVVAWSMEPGYFVDDPRLGGDDRTIFLNLVGFRDEFFGPDAPLSRQGETLGHGARLLEHRPGSKIAILPSEGHRALEQSELARRELRDFIRHWLS